MLTNQRGSTLLTVLIINLVLIILGMSIISATIGSSKRTAMRDSEISITYGAIDAVDAFTTKLVKNLNEFKIPSYFTSEKTDYDSDLDSKVLTKTLNEFLEDPSIDKNKLKCINLIDVTGASPNYVFTAGTSESKIGTCAGNISEYNKSGLNLQDGLTRVYDLVIQTKNPLETQGNVEKLVTKRMILSPLPSFLRYAVGSESLYLNGSSNIVGNVFAQDFDLKNQANYTDKNNLPQITGANQFPSIIGNIYSTNAKILDKLKPDNFYNKTVPNLSHDSQFANIDFDQTFLYTIKKAFNSLGYAEGKTSIEDIFSDYSSKLTEEITTKINDEKNVINSTGFEFCKKEDEKGDMVDDHNCYKSIPKIGNLNSINIKADSIIIGDDELELNVTGPLYVTGDLTIYAKEKLTIADSIYVNGNVTIVADSELTIGNEDTDFFVNGNVNLISSKKTTINSNLLTTGTISLTNFDTELTINKSIISAKDISIISTKEDKTTLNNLSENFTKINNGLISGSSSNIKSENMKTIINNNLFINGDFIISGNQEVNNQEENDNVLFKSVIYVNGATTISNTNISTIDVANDNLVLLSKGNLLLTRINEFRYYDEESEKTTNYLPLDSESIKPIKGFFYTDRNAELYGVGSLFYVHGGIFAKDKLVINAVRGETTISNFSPPGLGKLSRFIVKYYDSILFNSLTSLPIVENLQLIMDEQTVQ